MRSQWLKVHPDDTVVVALRDYAAGESVQVEKGEVILKDNVPSGHKIAIREVAVGADIIKYGYPIGKASTLIQTGEWVHTHNVQTGLTGALEYEYLPTKSEKAKETSSLPTFQGYIRKNGEVGVRNEIWIINTVGCINKTAEMIARLGNERFQREGVDGVYHFPHPFGCSQLGDDLHNTQKILASLVHHPNAAGVLVLGLGCENNYLASFKEAIGPYEEERVKFLGVQEAADEIEEGLALIEELSDYAASFSRQPVPVSRLRVGLKCGGSDGFSGITANPLVGAFSDRLIAHGGTTVLTEVPEMFGAETILMQRAENEHVFTQMVGLINGFKDYFIKHGQPVYENPSPGNKEGGITTLEEKSLGCVQKGGFAPVMDILPYGGRVTKPGLNIVQGPGNDLVSVTALSAAGAHIVLFTTGRGTPFGGPVPTVKISTNSQLYEKKKNWIDFNAGSLLEGNDIGTLSSDLFQYLIQLASGEKNTQNERFGYKEIAIFKDGVIL
ncbi:UxaA family hydrolase [Desmospora activa]|uniref:D-altronate dehydratase n=1 Tax=Desmospora activa DSM 45169 TaxID=1121389 RepID=A0A2T4ZDM7_9BACL|nr:altronate dehydratase family protein [Desmospora activa]PTM59987.1 D-altronate dehydratase [Desmospora activa DSM 45169]